METLPFWMPLAFFFVALLYSMFGFGGGSSYLALLVLGGFSYQKIPMIALTCNLVVASVAFYQYFKGRHFEFKKILPFVILSIPMAYLGGSFRISKTVFSLLLGLSLSFVALRMILGESVSKAQEPSEKKRWIFGTLFGGGIGFLSGLLGIGGGIFLSPFLMLIRWADSKQAAAAASFFILVNSLAGLAAHMQKTGFETHILLPLAVVVFLGGQMGSRLGAFHIPKAILQRMVAVFIMFAAVKLIQGGL